MVKMKSPLLSHLNLRNLSYWFFIYCLGTILVPIQLDVGLLAGLDPLTIGLIAGGSMAVSSGMQWLLGSKQVKATEQQNQLNREHDIQMLNAEQQYNASQVNKANEYNTPVNQVARLREAGLNPAVLAASGNVSSGQSSAASAHGSSTKGEVPDYSLMAHSLDPVTESAGQLFQSFANPDNQAERDLKYAQIQNDNLRTLYQSYETANNVHLGRAQSDMMREQIRRSQEDQSTLMNQVRAQTAQQRESARLTRAQSVFQEELNKVAPDMNQAQLSHLKASVGQLNAAAAELRSQIGLNNAETKLSLERKAYQTLENSNFVQFDENQKSQMAMALVKQAVQSAAKTGAEAKEAERFYNYGPWITETEESGSNAGIPYIYKTESKETNRYNLGRPSDRVRKQKKTSRM